MSFTSIDSIRTTNDLLAEKNQAQVNQDLDRNALLRLFTTQLQNQNPLDPMENEAFVAQLAQFSTLEATTLMSDSLSDFVSSQQSEKMLRGANLLGKQVFAPNVSMYQAGGTRLDGVISVDQTLDNMRLNVIDAESGQVVNQMDLGAQTQGNVEFSWNGGNFDGEAAPAGNYIFRAVGYQGDTTQEIPVDSQTRITGVSWDASLSEIFVEIEDGRSIALSEISHLSN